MNLDQNDKSWADFAHARIPNESGRFSARRLSSRVTLQQKVRPRVRQEWGYHTSENCRVDRSPDRSVSEVVGRALGWRATHSIAWRVVVPSCCS